MNPRNHLLLNRSLPNFRNIENNELCLKDMEKRLKCKFYISDLGRLITYTLMLKELKPNNKQKISPLNVHLIRISLGTSFTSH